MAQTKEIVWNIINSLLAGSLVFLGAFTSGNITWDSVIIALIVAGVVAITQFKNYWNKEEGEYHSKIFNLINI